MRCEWNRFAGLVALLAWVCAESTASAQLWKRFVPVSHSKPELSSDLSLTESNGPWLVMAATFSGENAESEARELAQELRERNELPSYIHAMTFDFSEERPGRGLDAYGAPVRRRYQREEAREFAVLVGNFPTIGDPDAQQLLERIKTMHPDALTLGAGEKSSQSLSQIREWQDQLLEKIGKKRDRGPMARAFMIRNPLLPDEFFVPKGVDKFVEEMNSEVEHNLLDCPARYTIKVATFRGKSVLQPNGEVADAPKSRWRWSRNDDDNPLVEAAENAHLLCAQLRAHGYEAYEFHDRTESIVTIGSFDQVMQRTADGREVPIPQVQKIVQTFDASYDTPADPLSGIGNDPTTQRLVEQQEQQFNMRLNSQQAQIIPGMHPKHVKILKGSGKRARVVRVIPMDVHPTAIEAPKRSISSAYAG